MAEPETSIDIATLMAVARLQEVNVRNHKYFEGLLHFGLSVPYFSTTRIQELTGKKGTWVWKSLHLHLSRIFLTVFRR